MLVCAAIVVVAMLRSMAGSLGHTDVVRPLVSVSELPGTIGLSIAASNASYITGEEKRAALRRLVRSKHPLFCGGTKKYAALTFDDGPSVTSGKLVDLLRANAIPVTWFDLGKNAEAYPEGLRRQAEFWPIGNHSWDHKDLTTLNKRDFKAEIEDTQELIKERTGQDNKMLRPPYGARSPFTEKLTRKLGFAEILWSSDSQDGLAKTAPQIGTLAAEGLGPGAIILFHDGTNPATIPALKKWVIPAIRRSGLTMVSIPDLLVLNPPSDDQLAAGPYGCRHAGRVNVSGNYLASPERY